MELENKKFKCHVSIIFEECAAVLMGMFALVLVNIGDFFDDSGEMTGEDAIHSAFAFVGIVFVALVFVLLRALFQWRKTTITIDRESIVWERNTLNKKKLTIGISHISSINIERNIFERIIGTAKLKIDTSSLSTANETDVTFLFKLKEALYYKEYLETMVRAMAGEDDENEETNESVLINQSGASGEEKVLGIPKSHTKQKVIAEFVASESEILLHCLYTISLFAVLIAVVPTVWGIVEFVRIIFSGEIHIGDLLGIATMVLTFGYASFYTLLGSLFRLYGLTVKRIGNRLHMKYGLLKIREYIIPVEKINAIHINQTFIGRIFHRYDVSMECVGVSDENNEIAQLTLSLPYDEAIRRVSLLLPEYDVAQIKQAEKIAPKAIWHKARALVIFTCIVICLIVGVFIGTDVLEEDVFNSTFWLISSFVIVFFYVYIGVSIALQMKTEAVIFGEDYITLVNGTFGKDIMLVSYKKIQYVTAKTSPISKWTGLVLGHINILAATAATTKKIPYINEDKVEFIKAKICER